MYQLQNEHLALLEISPVEIVVCFQSQGVSLGYLPRCGANRLDVLSLVLMTLHRIDPDCQPVWPHHMGPDGAWAREVALVVHGIVKAGMITVPVDRVTLDVLCRKLNRETNLVSVDRMIPSCGFVFRSAFRSA